MRRFSGRPLDDLQGLVFRNLTRTSVRAEDGRRLNAAMPDRLAGNWHRPLEMLARAASRRRPCPHAGWRPTSRPVSCLPGSQLW